ncbi:MAG: hypothetical protein ABJC12_06255 [Saprospiraceae bacterium]
MGSVRTIGMVAVCLTFVWLGCVKDPQDIPSGLTTDPVFGLIGNFGTEAFNIQAGNNEWTDQPTTLEGNSSIMYSSIFSKDACLEQCKPSLEFRFYSANSPSGNMESDFLQTIKTGSKDLVMSHQERDSFEISVNTQQGLFMSGYSYWENQNGSAISLDEDFVDVIGFGQYLDVCFQTLAYSGCQYSQCIHFNPATLTPCLASIHAKYEDSRTVSLNVVPEMGHAPFQIQWFDQSSDKSILLYHQDTDAEFYVGVIVTDAVGNSTVINQSIRLQDTILDECYFPISVQSVPVPNTDPSTLFNRAEIIYTDENGVEWSTSSGSQQQTPLVLIRDVTYFGLSPLHQPTYKVTLDINVELFNTAGVSKTFAVQGATIALSHP